MTSTIIPIDVPPSSRISRELPGAYFFDAYEIPLAHDGQSALDIYLKIVAKMPAWINFLMTVRNRVVAVLGLKNLGHLGDLNQAKESTSYRVGDRVGIFSLLSISYDEIILGDSDKHLDVKVSVCKLTREGRQSVAVTTVVHTHNLLGRIYMLFVAPVHRRIVPASLRAAGGSWDA
jgi:hypothetical protein